MKILITGINGFVGTNFTYVVEQLIVKENVESGIYHGGDDEQLSTNELIRLIRLISESVGKKGIILNECCRMIEIKNKNLRRLYNETNHAIL